MVAGSVARSVALCTWLTSARPRWPSGIGSWPNAGCRPGRAVPHDHHVWRLDVELADLSTAERLERVGLGLPGPGRRTWPPFQAVGEQLWREGWAGVVAPSAARPAARIASVFDRGGWPPEGCQPLRAIRITYVPVPPTGMTT